MTDGNRSFIWVLELTKVWWNGNPKKSLTVRVVEVGRYLWRSPGPSPCSDQGQPEHIAQNCVHLWRLNNTSGQHVLVFDHPPLSTVLLQAEQSQTSQPPLIYQMFQSLNHLSGPLLDSLHLYPHALPAILNLESCILPREPSWAKVPGMLGSWGSGGSCCSKGCWGLCPAGHHHHCWAHRQSPAVSSAAGAHQWSQPPLPAEAGTLEVFKCSQSPHQIPEIVPRRSRKGAQKPLHK